MASFSTSEITFEDVERRLSAIVSVCGTDTEDRIYENLMEMYGYKPTQHIQLMMKI
jgi:hypothetical protein